MTRERWDAEDILRDAVLYRMLLLAEIASALPEELRDRYPDVAWRHPYTDPVTGVLRNKLGLRTAEGLQTAEREITHAALILLGESPVHRPATT